MVDNIKLFDCFMFLNELDLLELRLNEYNNLVDYFVISESTITHSGFPKKLYYEENKNRYKKFWPKIIHQIILDTPENYMQLEIKNNMMPIEKMIRQKINNSNWWNKWESQWGREIYQRESLIKPLLDIARDNDIILISDIDEFPSYNKLKDVIDTFDFNQIYQFENNVYYYYLNYQKDEKWIGTFALSFKNSLDNELNKIRMSKDGILIKDAGCHFSYLGSIDNIKQKIESYSHVEFNNDFIKDRIEDNINNMRDLFGRMNSIIRVPIKYETHPKNLVDNQKLYANYIIE